ncbi:sigma-70 family RNA polymerase sigma factor [Ruminococcus sp.]|uniref:sigma-70 family RNA polymerase sigma factor n=1 Tax=Ruminococcus sp. TaxID=41978 RepID=UPI0025D19F32|nr:sigma-70 family RNA polymerase sigma factor [Ruminococcus sp.]MCI5815650.1 sigma-70 family RNA polymerase sigma factor [Ruminococcus sp.]MDD7556473.1 sigma-70 family RNA polymerase sigma factor [Ruminococcus sp.]MDY4963125.1 sigma-70 family RNA polymerase sigma factor [Ruminococcus callidus]
MSTPCSQPRAEENLGLVHLCANRFRGRGVEYDDLYSAGCIGLMKAVNAFDTERGVRFSTYAVPVILGEIKRLFRDGGTVKVSRSMKELSMRVVRLRDELRMQNGTEPTVQQLSREMGVEENDIVQALCVSIPPVSLTDPEEGGEGQLDIPVPPPDTEIGDVLALRQIMQTLSEQDRLLLTMRYYQNKTQSQTAQALGMTQVQVSRREKKLLLAMREELLR